MKMKNLRSIAVAALLALMALVPASVAYAKGWEAVKPEKVMGNHVISDAELEIKVGGGLIFITSSKHINIKIFTILGSRIADDNLSAGTYQFAVPTHGVYIVKAGDLTCKVAV